MLTLLLAAALAAPAAADAVLSRDGHFEVSMPAGYVSVIDQYPAATHSHIVAAWSVPGPGFKRLEIAVQSLRHMKPEELAQPALSSCERWRQLDEVTGPCIAAALPGGLSLVYTIRASRVGTDALTGFFDLGHGLAYCVLDQVPSGTTRDQAVSALLAAFASLKKADAFDPAATRPAKCEQGAQAVYENWPKAGDWKCRPVKEEGRRIFAPTPEAFNPYRRVTECPNNFLLARMDAPMPGDFGCVDMAQTNQRLLERFNHTRIFKCAKNELPVLFKRDGRARDFVCEKDKTPKPPPDEGEPGAQ
jgi:hypothetical protein